VALGVVAPALIFGGYFEKFLFCVSQISIYNIDLFVFMYYYP